ncbi:hypothetical protein Q5H93_05070 [Hymenobacter sp. ASUV-10]|uniref:Uncharacterized protein n=1 Tax=Hymenobacter aranciens TaxID=3063996 RepID=A0ABT9B744_9BACT|nr:hypothetical protein [Hymenobacter sp. ASUV-10]MDO7874095.1 hypothetical protein [Hymenobacter sp. ASUV-10]
MPYTITELTDHRLTLQSPYQYLPSPLSFPNGIASWYRTELH